MSACSSLLPPTHLPLHVPFPPLAILQVDVWAVGVLAYELMMGGATPFFNECTEQTEKLIQQVEGLVGPWLSSGLEVEPVRLCERGCPLLTGCAA